MALVELPNIKNDDDLTKALERLDVLMDLDPEPYTDENAELTALAALIEEYEKAQGYGKTDDVTAIDLIEFMMEQSELQIEDMVEYFGSVEKTKAILSGESPLDDVNAIRKLHVNLGIPLEPLIMR